MLREEAKTVLYEWQKSMVEHGVPLDTSKVQALRVAIEALSERTGEWIFNPKDAIELMFTKPKCSECGFESSDGGNFCPNCGARMLNGGEQDGNV